MVYSTNIVKVKGDDRSEETDLVAIEEPLELKITYWEDFIWKEYPLTVTMRTPGNDEELALGFLFSEHIIAHCNQVDDIRHCPKSQHPENTLMIRLSKALEFNLTYHKRNFFSHSSCGVCGKTAIDNITQPNSMVFPQNQIQILHTCLYQLPHLLLTQQLAFTYTGGLHAAALFDTKGELIIVREDIGRHNALDKLIGAALQLNLIPLQNYILLVSGRVSFELIQKSLSSGITFMAAIGAPSSLAVQLAQEHDMTLVGFLKENRCNVYAGKHRIIFQQKTAIHGK